MKYLKWLNLIPLIMFFIVDKLRGTLISRYLLIIIVVLGVINMKVGYELYKRMGFEEVGEKDGIVSMRMSLLRTE